jgi:hypothetical protein
MRRRFLTELASNPDLISGIYNYCDRWCERCPLTSRCLVYMTEQEYADTDTLAETNDTQNQKFWIKLGDLLNEAQEMMIEWALKEGFDLNEPIEEEVDRQKRKQHADNHPLTRAGKKYANDSADWFSNFDQLVEFSDQQPTESETEKAEEVEDAREVINWYQYQIAVKTMRALSSLIENREFEREWAAEGYPKDSDGAAKVALIGIDRSIAAWHLMQLNLTDRRESIVPLILQLERLRLCIERKFPDARSFIRPGFDEQFDETH